MHLSWRQIRPTALRVSTRFAFPASGTPLPPDFVAFGTTVLGALGVLAIPVVGATVLCALGILSAFAPSPALAVAPDLTPAWGHPSPHGNPIYDYEFHSGDDGVAVGLAGSVLVTTNGGVDWTMRADLETFGKDLYGVDTEDGMNLVAVGESPGVFRSTDGGTTWAEVTNPSTGTLFHLIEQAGGRLDAAGANGEVIRSTDDGATWTEIGPGVGVIESQWWETDQHGWVVGDEVAHETTDGGATWTQFIDFDVFGYHDVRFYDADFGRVMADFAVWTTTDGGASWTEEDAFSGPLYPRKTLPLTPDHWLLITNIEGAELWETLDRGETWEMLVFQPSIGFLDLARTPNGRIFYASDIGDLWRSDDLGRTNVNATTRLDGSPSGPVTVFSKAPGGHTYAVVDPSAGGVPSSWLRSTDLGASWTGMTKPALTRPTSMVWPSDAVGIVGGYQDLERTTDGGATWILSAVPSGRNLTELALAGDRVFFGSYTQQTGDGTIHRSTDEGATWSDVGTDLAANFAPWDLFFIDRDTGYAAGVQQSGSPFPRLYATTDSGTSWSLRTSPPGGFARDMYWFDAQTGLAALGFDGIYRTTDGGGSWSQTSTLRAQTLSFRGELGIATGTYSSDATVYSTDGGVTWAESELPMAAGGSCVLATETGFVLGGHGSAILQLTGSDVAGVDDVVGEGGVPAGTDGRTGTGLALRMAGAHPAEVNVRFILSLATPGRVGLDVYDSSGRRVRALASGFRSAGSFPIEWDGRDESGRVTPSGLYFVRAGGVKGAETLRVVRAR